MVVSNMISVIEGRPGMGKTIFLVNKILTFLRYGHVVYTNVDLSTELLPEHYLPRLHKIESLEDIIQLRSGKIVLDEVQTYLNSRNWDKLDIRFQLLLQQHRKRGLDIIGATQSIKRADVVFRELVAEFYTVKKLFTIKLLKNHYGLFIVRQYDPDTIERDRDGYVGIGFPRLSIADPFTFKVYDTTQEISIDDGIGDYVTEKYRIVQKPVVSRVLVDRVRESSP